MTSHEQEIADFGKNNDFWLFGYGSLIWKPPPHYDQRVPGYIEGYVRRFWQASQDHRGTPEDPGRVVTLITHEHWETLTDHHKATERVWGAAYHIPKEHVAAVREYLDIREINGYSIQFTPFHVDASSLSNTSPHQDTTSATSSSTTSSESRTLRCLVYIGLPSNPQFLSPQDPDTLAKKILESRGPSGENKEYLFNLEKALGGLSKDSGDEHVSDLVRRCKKIEEKEGVGDKKVEEVGTVGHVLHRVGSTEEQEEVEK